MIRNLYRFILVLIVIILGGCQASKEFSSVSNKDNVVVNDESTSKQEIDNNRNDVNNQNNKYSIEQAISDNAQLSTIAFSGLAFITGNQGADTFFPPGKLADFFGFQYMRDVDIAGYGHNTQFLSRVANNVLFILDDKQKQKLIELAKTQAPLYIKFAYNRFPIMEAFRQSLEEGTVINQKSVASYTSKLYEIDADISYNRAIVMGNIANSLSDEQLKYLEKMSFNDFNTWPDVKEDEELKKALSNTEFVAVMTYASEFFSWYKGSLEADIYFCPERHGTYFGGFFMKDYPAMNNPEYFISTSVTGDKGKMFLEILNSEQRKIIENIIPTQKTMLEEIVTIRTDVATELRKILNSQAIDKDKVYNLIERYGYLDGMLSSLYASSFSIVKSTLTNDQFNKLVELRDLNVIPKGAYMFSSEVPMPEIPNIDYMFEDGDIPSNAADYDAPSDFIPSMNKDNQKPRN